MPYRNLNGRAVVPRHREWIDTVPQAVRAQVGIELVEMMAQQERDAAQQLREIVHVAYQNGISWGDIAQALGVTKSAAWQRFGNLDTAGWMTWQERQRQAQAQQ